MKNIIKDNHASIIPPFLFLISIIGGGALYTLFFIEIGIPILNTWFPVPASDSKTFIFMIIYAIPVIITLVGLFALFLSGLKRRLPYYPGGG